MSYDKNVFINCPYDKKYLSLLRKMIFTIMFFGYNVQIVCQDQNSATPRLDKIFELIKNSKFGIHDLSRNKIEKKSRTKRKKIDDSTIIFRLNMAFELGIDIGIKKSKEEQRNKKFLILDAEDYLYQKAISDINGLDIQNHKNNQRNLIKILRDWFVAEEELTQMPSADNIWIIYNTDFLCYYNDKYVELGFKANDIDKISIPEYIQVVKKFLNA